MGARLELILLACAMGFCLQVVHGSSASDAHVVASLDKLDELLVVGTNVSEASSPKAPAMPIPSPAASSPGTPAKTRRACGQGNPLGCVIPCHTFHKLTTCASSCDHIKGTYCHLASWNPRCHPDYLRTLLSLLRSSGVSVQPMGRSPNSLGGVALLRRMSACE